MDLPSPKDGCVVLPSHSEVDAKTKWIKRAIWLSWFTIIYNVVEGLVSIGFGVSDDSVALAGFGVDSLIEVASAVLVLWRFRGEHGRAHALGLDRERKATFGIGLLFLLLGVVVFCASGYQLLHGSHPETTVPGIVISLLSLSFMFFLWRAKLAAATALGSATVEKDANCSRACIQLSSILFVGSLIYLLLPQAWWVDSAAAVALSALIVKEGWETVQAVRNEDFSGGCGCAKRKVSCGS